MRSEYLTVPEGFGTFASPRWSAVLAAVAVGLGAARLGLTAYGAAPTGAASGELLYYGVVGAVVAALYYVVVDSLSAVPWLRLVSLVLAFMLFASWFARPVLSGSTESGTVLTQSAQEQSAGGSLASRDAWLGRLIAAGRYAPPNVPPPFLEARHGENGVSVVNRAGKAVTLALASVTADRTANGGWRGCALTWRDGASRRYWVTLAPDQLAFFERGPLCGEIVLNFEGPEEIEYRVGDETTPIEEGWWSTSALVAPSGRETEDGSGRIPLPRSYDPRPFFGAER